MFLNSGFDIVKKAGLLVFLLMPSMIVQAQVSDAAVTTASDTAASDTAANTDTSDAAVTTVEAQAAEAAETSVSEDQPSEDQQHRFSFPRWPESRQINRERVPLAPPGPYMSSALSDYSFKEPSFDRAFDRLRSRRASMMDPPDMSMEQFSPDIPWPSHAKSPDRWQPENGYRYVEPRVNNKPYQVMPYNTPSNYNYGYRTPDMNWPDRAGPGAASR